MPTPEATSALDRLPIRSAWPLRIVWLLQPILVGPVLGDALADRSRAVQFVASSLAWGLWVVGVGASSVLRTTTLTTTRLVVPAAFPVAAWAAWRSDDTVAGVVAVAAAAVALVALGAPGLSDAFVDGSSYGRERRVALRVPPGILLVPLPLAWALGMGTLIAGPLLLAARQWAAGAATSALGLLAVAVLARQLHGLSRRWLVFVPAGIVVHDPLTLSEPVLCPRRALLRVGPTTSDAVGRDDVIDTTGGALGLVLEVRVQEPVKVGVRRGRRTEERSGIRAFLVSPTQPATTLQIAHETRLPVG